MPDWLRWPAEHQPITPVIETIRALLMGGDASGAWLPALLWCVGIVVVAFAWGGWLYRRKAGRR
jgi:ABC-2 type transport system permease protein